MKKLVMITTTLLVIAILVSPTFAFNERGHKGFGSGPWGTPCGDPAAMAGLNLTADQKTKIDDLRISHLKDVKPLMDKIFILRGDLRLLWLEKNPDQAKITAVQKEIRTIRGQIDDKRTAYQLEILKILTPEQQARFKESCARGDFGGHRHGMGPGGPGPGMRN